MNETRVLPESWNVPSGPSHSNHGDPASSSKSAAISKRPLDLAAGVAQLDVPPQPRRQRRVVGGHRPVGQRDLDVVADQARRRVQQLGHPAGGQRQAGAEVDQRPLAVTLDAELVDRGRGELLALHRLDGKAPQAHDTHPPILPERESTPSPHRLHAGATPVPPW